MEVDEEGRRERSTLAAEFVDRHWSCPHGLGWVFWSHVCQRCWFIPIALGLSSDN